MALWKHSVQQNKWNFSSWGRRPVIGRFDSGRIISGAKVLLLREVEGRFQMLKRLAARGESRARAASHIPTCRLGGTISSVSYPKCSESNSESFITRDRLLPLQFGQCLSPQSVDAKKPSHSKHFRIMHFPRRTNVATHLRYCRGVRPNCT